MKSVSVKAPAAEAFAGENTPDYSVACLLFQVLASWNTWCLLIFILYLGDKYLNGKNNLLSYGGVASFPFYLLHFPVVVVAAYYVLPLHVNLIAAFVCISACVFLGTLALTDLLFMRLRGARMMFGSKRRWIVVEKRIAGLLAQAAGTRKFHQEMPSRVRSRVLTGTLM
jgi:peptidoglycan/LPS O-acetylase OafA/YrhL